MQSTCVANSKNDLHGAQPLPGATESLTHWSQSACASSAVTTTVRQFTWVLQTFSIPAGRRRWIRRFIERCCGRLRATEDCPEWRRHDSGSCAETLSKLEEGSV